MGKVDLGNVDRTPCCGPLEEVKIKTVWSQDLDNFWSQDLELVELI